MPHDDFLRGTRAVEFGDDRPITHHQDAVAEANMFGQLARCDDDGAAAIGKFAQQTVDLRLGADIDAAGRLLDD